MSAIFSFPRHMRGPSSNALMLDDRWQVGRLRVQYRRLRRAGCSQFEARYSLWETAWVASMHRPTFVAGHDSQAGAA